MLILAWGSVVKLYINLYMTANRLHSHGDVVFLFYKRGGCSYDEANLRNK